MLPYTREVDTVLRAVPAGAAAGLIAAFLLALVACTGRSELSQSEQTSYIDDNQRLLDSLPQIPGSERLDMQSNPYCSSASPLGYSTFEHRRTAKPMSHDEIVDSTHSTLVTTGNRHQDMTYRWTYRRPASSASIQK